MRTMLWIHVAGGGLGLAAGFAALSAAKGSGVHRTMGRVFVYAMLAMGLSGALIAAMTGVETSVVMGILAAYLVFTGWTTIAPVRTASRWPVIAGTVVAIALALALAELGIRALQSPSGAVEGLPAPMAFLFATIALIAGVSDARIARGLELRRGQRLARHLWRMCFALFIASASFFLGQTQVLPVPLRAPWFLVPPVLAPLLLMGYWLWRTRIRQVVRGGARTATDAA